MMNLRQRINHELENFHSGVEYHAISPEQRGMALDAYTDRILTEVREALLSDEAIVAAQRGITSYVWDPENQEEIIHRKMLGATRSGIKEALDSLA